MRMDAFFISAPTAVEWPHPKAVKIQLLVEWPLLKTVKIRFPVEWPLAPAAKAWLFAKREHAKLGCSRNCRVCINTTWKKTNRNIFTADWPSIKICQQTHRRAYIIWKKNRSKRVLSMLERQTLKTKERLTKLNAKSGQKKGSRSLETGRHSDDAHSCTLLHLKSDILTFAWFATECPDGCSSRMLCQRIANFLFVMH